MSRHLAPLVKLDFQPFISDSQILLFKVIDFRGQSP